MNIDLGNLRPASLAKQGRVEGQGFVLGSPLPAMVEMKPVAASIFRILLLLLSET
jgi:hypothetical protein